MKLKDTLKENNYSILSSNGYYSFDTGIRPVLCKVVEDRYFFKDCSVADKVIGKASAMLLAYSGAKEVDAIVMSKAGEEVLKKYGISYDYDRMVDYIENMRKDGMCPMELTVKDIDEPEEAYEALKKKLSL